MVNSGRAPSRVAKIVKGIRPVTKPDAKVLDTSATKSAPSTTTTTEDIKSTTAAPATQTAKTTVAAR
ncbi:hypothetical protein GQ42DRAFT_165765 [Ramicandelaber brevisporus]|nr:hypothetical protein GQ42DRAFT_165765 [Ramicandelaber brevisporus]